MNQPNILPTVPGPIGESPRHMDLLNLGISASQIIVTIFLAMVGDVVHLPPNIVKSESFS